MTFEREPKWIRNQAAANGRLQENSGPLRFKGMRFFFILAVAAGMGTNAFSQTMVPESTSPDGKTALYYVHLPSSEMNVGYELYFQDTQSLKPLSGNLVPAEHTEHTTDAAMDDMDSNILLNGIGSHLEASRRHILWDPAFSYFVTWSPDSQWVSIEGGAHKFWRAMIYHCVNGRFALVNLPQQRLFEYFYAHKNDPQVPDLGAAEAIRKISPRDYDYPNVCWLKNGTLAINAYPYLFTHSFFFVLDATANPATITGFCK